MTRGRAGMAAAAVAVAAAGACTARDTVAISGAVGGDLEEYCDGPARLADDTCTGALAESLFRHGVCGCAALSFGGDLTTDGFNSAMGPYAPGGSDGHVGSNVGLDASQQMIIGGDLTVGGPEGIEAGTVLEVKQELASGDQLGRSSSTIRVGGGARVAGPVSVDSLTVEGTLLMRNPADRSGDVVADIMAADVTVDPPCRCADSLDVARVIAEHAVVNHNEEFELEPDALVDIEGDRELGLPCGRFYLDAIGGGGAGDVAIRANGRTALFVAGDITLPGDLTIELGDDQAELDMFVGGFIQVTGALTVGHPERPRAVRLYVGSGGSITLSPGSALAANLHAPLADLASPEPLEIFGSVVVHRVNGGDTVTVHHDRAIADAGNACLE